MSDFSSLNDPYEGQLCYIPEKRSNDPEVDIIERFFLTSERDKYIQSSFSYDYHSILMWGHYANALKGYCIEYEIQIKGAHKRLERNIVTGDKLQKLNK